jgi:hypothetical protein
LKDKRLPFLFHWKEPRTWAPLNKGWRLSREPEQVARTLIASYGGVRVYHAGRPVSVDSYYRRGVLPADHQSLHADPRTIFSREACPELEEGVLEAAIAAIGNFEEGNAFRNAGRPGVPWPLRALSDLRE